MESQGRNFFTTKLSGSKNFLSFVFLFIFLILFDQLTKQRADPVFYNKAFAFSLPLPVWLIYGLYLFFISVMLVYVNRHFKQFSIKESYAWLLIFSGAVSNIVERIICGYVIDWIYIFNGILNLADFYIILGLILLVIKKQNR